MSTRGDCADEFARKVYEPGRCVGIVVSDPKSKILRGHLLLTRLLIFSLDTFEGMPVWKQKKEGPDSLPWSNGIPQCTKAKGGQNRYRDEESYDKISLERGRERERELDQALSVKRPYKERSK